MIKVLIIVFVLLSLLAGGDRTAKSLMTTAINVTIFAVLIELIYLGFNIVFTTAIAAILITATTVFTRMRIISRQFLHLFQLL